MNLKASLRAMANRLAPHGSRRRQWLHRVRAWIMRPRHYPFRNPWDRTELARFLRELGMTIPAPDDPDPQRRLLGWLLADDRFLRTPPPRLGEAVLRDLGEHVARTGDVALLRAFNDRPRLAAVHRFDHDPSLPMAFPLALTPGQWGDYALWLARHSNFTEVTPEAILWFLLEAADDPSQGLHRTYLRRPDWQLAVPDALTPVGWPRLVAWVRQQYHISDRWLAEAVRPARIESTTEPGVNVLAHFRYPSGLQVAASNTVEALGLAGLTVSPRDVPAGCPVDTPGRGGFLGLHPFKVTISQLAPEPLAEECYERAGLAIRPGVHRIGYWYWELEEVPESWKRHASWLHELWAPTRFIGEALRKTMPMPVIDMLAGMRMPPEVDLPRSRFGLRDDRFLFLFVFDMCSTFDRKNPLAVVEAYRRAFPRPTETALAIKVSRGQHDPDSMRQLRETCSTTGVTLIDEVLPHDELFGLIRSCDAYVSLHRSEGYGLTMAEAMALGKPVIATGYSGNLDFMTAQNSLLVQYKRTKLTRTVHVYREGCEWVEPDVDHAAHLMRHLFEHPETARTLGERARLEVRQILSLEAAGRRMVARLAELGISAPSSAAA